MSKLKEEFEKEFKDLTHFGCPSTPEVPCATLREDIFRWFLSRTIPRELLIQKIKEEIWTSHTLSNSHISEKEINDLCMKSHNDVLLDLLALISKNE